MSLAHARALLPGAGNTNTNEGAEPFIAEHDPQHDRRAMLALGQWAMRFSPVVATDPTGDGLLLDITGCQRVFKGEPQLAQQLYDATQRLGIRARIAVAPTFGCAWAVARYGPHDVTLAPDDGIEEAIAPLPIEALRVDADICDALAEVGVFRIGELLNIPRDELPSRFGRDLLLRIDQAFGRAIAGRGGEAITPLPYRKRPRVQQAFDGPTTQTEAINLTAQRLLGELAADLQARESGARQLSVRLDRADMPPAELSISLSRPSRDVKHLWSLLRPKLEGVNLGFGVDCVTLDAQRIGRLPHTQQQRWRSEQTERKQLDEAFGQLLDVLANRLTPYRLLRIETKEAHLPEAVFKHAPLMSQTSTARNDMKDGSGANQAMATKRSTKRTGKPSVKQAQAMQQHASLISHQPYPRMTFSDRPSVLLTPPEPIEVIASTLSPAQPAPRWLRWRGIGRHITAALGPERLAPPWWEQAGGWETSNRDTDDAATHRGLTPAARETEDHRSQIADRTSNIEHKTSSLPHRDYFKLQDEYGQWLWVFRQHPSRRWFIHGQWG